MTEPIPDWAVNIPPTTSVHTIPIKGEGGQGPDTSGLLANCANIFGSRAFTSGLMTDGAGAAGGPTGEVLQGTQNFADTMCGYATGVGSTGTNPQTVVDGVSDTTSQIHANPFVSELLGMNGGQSNLILDGLCGLQTFLGLLCGVGTGSTDVSATTPSSIVDTAQASASTGVLMLAGVPSPAAIGTDVVAAGQTALNVNTAKHVRAQSLSTAQSVVVLQENLLISQDFSHEYNVAVDPDGVWVWNGADGAVTLGCLQATADGDMHEYVSNEVAVAPGENLELSCFYKCASLSFSGSNPIVFGIQKYRLGKTAAGAVTYLDVGGADISVVAAPSPNTDWTGLAGTYTVPPGVNQVRFRFRVNANAASGTVKFDEANLLKTDLIPDEAVPGVGTTVDNIVTELYGDAGAGFTHNTAAVALGNTAAALTSVTAKVAQLEAEGYGGAIAGDDFSWTGELLASANWGGVYTGSALLGDWRADGQNAAMVPNNEGFGLLTMGELGAMFVWAGDDAISSTDYQIVQTVLDSPPQYFEGYATAYLNLFGRVAGDLQSYIELEVGGDGSYSVRRCVGGSKTVMDSGSCPVPGAGTIVSLYCGVKGVALRRFRVMFGSTTIADFTEVGTASQTGALNRQWGFGGWYNKFAIVVTVGGAFAAAPPAVNQWLAMDQ